MTVIRRPRRWVLTAVTAALLTSGWQAFVPVTAVYVTSDDKPAPRHVATHYTWWSTEQNLIYSDTGTNPQVHLVNGVRLDCAGVFSTGSHEVAAGPAGPQACSEIEIPRFVVALGLLATALLGLLLLGRVPAVSERYVSRYHQPYSQRRALRRGR